MDTGLSPALMSEEDDLERLRARRSGTQWWARLQGSPRAPVHRYAGILTIRDHSLVFRGMDLRERKDFEERIPLGEIHDVSLGLDALHDGEHNRSFTSGEPEPLVVRYRQNGRLETNYFVTNFPGLSRRLDGNRYWYERLRAELDRSRLQREALVGRN